MVVKKVNGFVKLKNPYTFGVPVRGKDKFFGREEELELIFNTLENIPRGQKQDLVVLGPRRIGKSSLLYRLVDLLMESNRDFVPVYIDVQSILPREIPILFVKILKEIKKGYWKKNGIKLPDFETLQSSNVPNVLEFLTFNEDMALLNNSIATEDLPRLVLMFDEVELLLDFGEAKILEWLRSLIQVMGYSIFVVAGSDRLYSLTQDYGSPFYNIFKTIELFPLAPDAARQLIEKPANEIGLEISSSEVDKILEYAGNNPYFIQGIAHYLIEELNRQQRYQAYSQDVDKVIIKCTKYLSPQFNYFWNIVSQPQRIILYALAKIGQSQTANELISRLPSVKTFLPSKEEQLNTFDSLIQQQILKKERGNRYWFVVLLFVDWILSSVDDEEIIELAKSLRSGEAQDTSAIRRFLTLAFSDTELQEFTFDTFNSVFSELSPGMSKGQIIERLVDYAMRYNQLDILVTKAKVLHPQQHEVFEKVIGIPIVGTTSQSPGFPERANRTGLRQLLLEYFNAYELRKLCFTLDVDYDSLPGQNKEDKATELVAYMDRHGRLDKLVEVIRQMRPHISWLPGAAETQEQVNLTKLRQSLTAFFNESELRSLAFELRIDYEALPGDGKKDKARELIAYIDRRGRLNELVQIAHERRPNIPWALDVSRMPEPVDSARLRQRLLDYFDESELRNLAFDLNIDYEILAGESKSSKVSELIAYMERHGRVHELVAICRKLRPKISW
jgi:AAA+ ATPase superfamily predicted ATPase